jgi:hypothetical protein
MPQRYGLSIRTEIEIWDLLIDLHNKNPKTNSNQIPYNLVNKKIDQTQIILEKGERKRKKG